MPSGGFSGGMYGGGASPYEQQYADQMQQSKQQVQYNAMAAMQQNAFNAVMKPAKPEPDKRLLLLEEGL